MSTRKRKVLFHWCFAIACFVQKPIIDKLISAVSSISNLTTRCHKILRNDPLTPTWHNLNYCHICGSTFSNIKNMPTCASVLFHKVQYCHLAKRTMSPALRKTLGKVSIVKQTQFITLGCIMRAVSDKIMNSV